MELCLSVIGYIIPDNRVGRFRRTSDLVIVNSRTPSTNGLLQFERNYFGNNRAEGRLIVFDIQAATIVKTLL